MTELFAHFLNNFFERRRTAILWTMRWRKVTETDTKKLGRPINLEQSGY